MDSEKENELNQRIRQHAVEANVAEMNKPDCETDMSNIGNQKVRLQNGKQDNVCILEYQSNAEVVHTQKNAWKRYPSKYFLSSNHLKELVIRTSLKYIITCPNQKKTVESL